MFHFDINYYTDKFDVKYLDNKNKIINILFKIL